MTLPHELALELDLANQARAEEPRHVLTIKVPDAYVEQLARGEVPGVIQQWAQECCKDLPTWVEGLHAGRTA